LRNITPQLPEKIKNHGGELFVLDLEDKKKFVLLNRDTGYRTFTYVSKIRESNSTIMSDLYNSYYCDMSLRTKTDRY
jgi:hypothetical protein